MPKLTYSGRISVETETEENVIQEEQTDADGNIIQQEETEIVSEWIPSSETDVLHTLLDDAIAAYEGDDVVLETAVVHFERSDDIGRNDMPRAHVKLSAEGDISELSTVEDILAQEIVAIGFEANEADAKEAIQIE